MQSSWRNLLPVTERGVTAIDGRMEADPKHLRRGWTTGTCAAAAAKAACLALLGEGFPDLVEVTLPGGQRPGFTLALEQAGDGFARAGIIKDAGDDPDVTHGALIVCTVRRGPKGAGLRFFAGDGVGMVTRAGLAIPPGEPAINPVPRQMIAAALAEVAGEAVDFDVEISVPGGAVMAEKTLNGRLGIVGGLSILGTTGIVIPFSCSAWIHSIWRGIDVARAEGLTHVAGATGMTSEKAVQAHHQLPETALLDMGDFVGGMLKYLKKHPVERVTVAGGVAKMTKLAQGMLDVHSKRGLADLEALASLAREAGGTETLSEKIRAANTVAEAFQLAQAKALPLGDRIAALAWKTAASALANPAISLEILVFDREGRLMGQAPFTPSDHALSLPPAMASAERNRRT
jgi:cobalt-precorrin-5B (C1)-methyltransferase